MRLATAHLLFVDFAGNGDGKKGDKISKRGCSLRSSAVGKGCAGFTLAVAANPSNVEYQLHFRRRLSMLRRLYAAGRALAEQRDFIGAYNAFVKRTV